MEQLEFEEHDSECPVCEAQKRTDHEIRKAHLKQSDEELLARVDRGKTL